MGVEHGRARGARIPFRLRHHNTNSVVSTAAKDEIFPEYLRTPQHRETPQFHQRADNRMSACALGAVHVRHDLPRPHALDGLPTLD
jgi:hypothetical protein